MWKETTAHFLKYKSREMYRAIFYEILSLQPHSLDSYCMYGLSEKASDVKLL